MPICTQGHQSTDTDYCSECGMRIGAVSLVATTSAAAGSSDICSDCGTPRNGGSRYCEVCRYDFQSKVSYAACTPVMVPVAAVAVPVATSGCDVSLPQLPAPASAVPTGHTVTTVPTTTTPVFSPPQLFNIEIIVDPSLAADAETAAQCPKNTAARFFPLDLAENLVGRRSDVKGVYPEIQVDDPGVSRRHLKLMRQADGCYAALDLGSTNGSIMNGTILVPGVLTMLKAGDEIVVGSWTKLRLAIK
ncbi:FHA domain-containing protein [Undibacterium sp. JH2W]|uniref:FHA domain-containing protein n=1 Tax=Undibacterium sp. JH2W TaxID=3413037 RepID=UPI003BEFB7D7